MTRRKEFADALVEQFEMLADEEPDLIEAAGNASRAASMLAGSSIGAVIGALPATATPTVQALDSQPILPNTKSLGDSEGIDVGGLDAGLDEYIAAPDTDLTSAARFAAVGRVLGVNQKGLLDGVLFEFQDRESVEKREVVRSVLSKLAQGCVGGVFGEKVRSAAQQLIEEMDRGTR